MVKVLLLRVASAAGLAAISLVLVGINPFLSAGAGLSNTPAFSVNRALKGDRLPIVRDRQDEFKSSPTNQPHAQMPFGCDPAFSPIFSPAARNVYRRCMA